jgi:hypothetical protein
LRVQESGPERVVLQIVGESAPPVAPLPLPGAPRLHVDHEESGGGSAQDGDRQSISLVFETPRLGPLGLRIEVHAGMTRAVVRARVGEPHELASTAAAALETALGRATARPAQVSVEQRRDPLDVYA